MILPVANVFNSCFQTVEAFFYGIVGKAYQVVKWFIEDNRSPDIYLNGNSTRVNAMYGAGKSFY